MYEPKHLAAILIGSTIFTVLMLILGFVVLRP